MLADFFISIINFIINNLGNIANVAISFLPESPFLFLQGLQMDSFLSTQLSYLNWVIPITSFLAITAHWLLAISVYYLVSIILRWVKLIQ